MTTRMYRHEIILDDQPHAYPLTSNPRHVAVVPEDTAKVEFWAEHADDAVPLTRWFQVFGTGDPLPDGARWRGTCPRTRMGLVWHLYEVEP